MAADHACTSLEREWLRELKRPLEAADMPLLARLECPECYLAGFRAAFEREGSDEELVRELSALRTRQVLLTEYREAPA